MECAPRYGFQQPAITDVMPRAMPSPVQQAEATPALFVAEHCAMNTTDHLGEACKWIFQDSKVASNIKIHRTKCTNVIIYTLNALLSVRNGLRRHKKCHEYSLPNDVVAKIGTMASYSTAEDDTLQAADIIEELCVQQDSFYVLPLVIIVLLYAFYGSY